MPINTNPPVVCDDAEAAYESIFLHKDEDEIHTSDAEDCVNAIVDITKQFTQDQVDVLSKAGFNELAEHIATIANYISARDHVLDVRG